MNKTKFQRILCVIVSCFLAFSVLTLPVLADVTEVPENFSYFLSDFKSYYSDYKEGNLTWGEFIEKTLQAARKLGYNNQAEINGYKDFISLLKSLGVDVDPFWTDFYYQRHGGESSSENRDEIMQGAGAVLYKYSQKSGSNVYYLEYIYYGDYGLFYNITSDTDFQYSLVGGFRRVSYSSSGDVISDQRSYDHGFFDVSASHNGYNLYYGDWRYDDGSSADDYISDIPEEPTPGYDDPSIPEDELEDFLEYLLNQLSLQFPDLSTIEGLLAALLAEMKTLDHDDDAASLSAVQSAIENLSSVGSSGNSEDVEKIISAINNTQFDYDKLVQCLTDLIGLNGDYSEISKLEIVKDKFSQKIGFVSSFADLCGKVITAYTKTSPSVSFDISLYGESHTISFDWLEQYMPTFRIMLCAFIYISYAWRTYRKVPEYIAGGGEDT